MTASQEAQDFALRAIGRLGANPTDRDVIQAVNDELDASGTGFMGPMEIGIQEIGRTPPTETDEDHLALLVLAVMVQRQITETDEPYWVEARREEPKLVGDPHRFIEYCRWLMSLMPRGRDEPPSPG
jgi:hypothetical protein